MNSVFPKFLKWYLIITGVMTLVAMAVPDLVVIGLFLLILPGLILGASPTSFLWGVIYSLFWVAIRTCVDKKTTSLLAIPATALLLWAIPQPSRLIANHRLETYKLDNITAAKPVRVFGNIRIDSEFPRWDNKNEDHLGFRPYACDNRCIALLFEPGVTSVTVNKMSDISFEALRSGVSRLHNLARTYRLLPKAQCGANSLIPDLEGRAGYFGKTMQDNHAFSADWAARLTSDVCFTGSAPLKTYDMLIRTGNWQSEPDISRHDQQWSLGAGNVKGDYAEIRNGKGDVLYRYFAPRVSAVAFPLYINYIGSSRSAFGWGRGVVPKKQGWTSGEKLLEDVLDVRRTVDTARLLQNVRSTLKQTIADSSQPADNPAFKNIDDYIKLIEKSGATEDDARIITTLINDPRLDDLQGAWALPKIFSATQLEMLRPAIVRKLLSVPADRQTQPTQLGRVLFDWPEGAFAKTDPDTRALLKDPAKRHLATGLIARQSDQGAAAVPLLVDILTYHVDAWYQLDNDDTAFSSAQTHERVATHRNVINAALNGLCSLGPKAGAALPALMALEKGGKLKGDDKSKYEAVSQRKWDRTLARIGKPVASFHKPNDVSGGDESYRRKIAYFLEHFDANRDCGSL